MCILQSLVDTMLNDGRAAGKGMYTQENNTCCIMWSSMYKAATV